VRFHADAPAGVVKRKQGVRASHSPCGAPAAQLLDSLGSVADVIANSEDGPLGLRWSHGDVSRGPRIARARHLFEPRSNARHSWDQITNRSSMRQHRDVGEIHFEQEWIRTLSIVTIVTDREM
jgi:hypothetical protein